MSIQLTAPLKNTYFSSLGLLSYNTAVSVNSYHWVFSNSAIILRMRYYSFELYINVNIYFKWSMYFKIKWKNLLISKSVIFEDTPNDSSKSLYIGDTCWSIEALSCWRRFEYGNCVSYSPFISLVLYWWIRITGFIVTQH